MVVINGEKVEEDNKSIDTLVKEKGYNISRIAIELNGNIVPKCNYENTILKDGDKLEVVTFVGGG